MEKHIILIIIALSISIVINLCLTITSIIVSLNKSKCESSSANIGTRIVGGVDVDISHHKYMAAIVLIDNGKYELYCGTSIIAKYWSLTAGHCVRSTAENIISLSKTIINSGSGHWKNGKPHRIISFIEHENYVYDTSANDIALIKVKDPFQGDLEVPIPLAYKKYNYKTNSTAVVIGWGTDQFRGVIQNALQKVIVTIMDQDYCKNQYDNSSITSDMFCAGSYFGGRDACQYDSGGPITQENILIGIVSWGRGCGFEGSPGVYVKVGVFHEWIKNKLQNTKGLSFVT